MFFVKGNVLKAMNFFARFTFLLPIGLAGLLTQCSPKVSDLSTHRDLTSPGLVTRAAQAKDFLTLNSLLLVPIVISDKARGAEKVAMDSNLEEAVGRELSLDIVKSRERFPKTSARSAKDALVLARQAGADGVIFASIDNYKERVGSRLGVTEPASLGFSIVVLRARDSKEIWSGSYSYQDQPLSDNLLTIKDSLEHPGWKSAQDLFTTGLREALRDFAERRVGQFSTIAKQG
jgi:hypothetical protein